MARWLLGAAALACSAMACAAPCPKPAYPRESLRLLDEGISLIGFLIAPDGSVSRSVVLSSSGSVSLDEAARQTLSKCTFIPVQDGGKPIEAWEKVMYTWSLDDDPTLAGAKRVAAEAARNGNADARYQLGLLLGITAKSAEESRRAQLVAQSAADAGQPHAQYNRGVAYERGQGVEVDVDEALRWYRKAADQGDVFAIQRLKLGKLPAEDGGVRP